MDQIAIIDIGSNSVRYMEAECTFSHVHSLFKSLQTTRLAEGQDAKRTLMKEPMERSAAAVRAYAKKARGAHIPVFAYATSAVREASNQKEFLTLIGDACPVTVLSGKEEGRLAYAGATGGTGTLLDIGGGSMQVVLSGEDSWSAPIGCVRFKDRCGEDEPDVMRAYLQSWAETAFQNISLVPKPVTGVGGTITTIGALLLGQTEYDGRQLETIRITPRSLREMIRLLHDMGEKRKDHPLLKHRHDVILYGAVILEYLMERFAIDAVTPSDRDGMEGFAEAILQEKLQ